MNEYNDNNNPGQDDGAFEESASYEQSGASRDDDAPTEDVAQPLWREQSQSEWPGPNAPYAPPRQNGGPYSQQGGYNGGYPQGGYPPYDQNRQQPPQYNPYQQQYNANSGWQHYPPPPAEKYEWKFEDYEKLDSRKPGGKRNNRGMVVFTVLLLGFLSVGLIGLAGYSFYTAAIDPVAEDDASEVSELAADSDIDFPVSDNRLEIAARPEINDAPANDGKMTIPQVAEAVMPSVVGVIMYSNNQYYEISGYGSGIIMSEDGYIITNAHVVEGGTGYKIQFSDGEAYDAELRGFDTVTDLAVMKIDADGLIPAQFGDSDSVKIGEPVVAIGNPGGDVLANSLTYGVISALNREVYTTSSYKMNYIQTDAAINPGNSGGALVNEYGQVIGINSAKITATGYEGIGFAIPISSAKPIIDDIIVNGRVTGRVLLGISSRMSIDEIDARNYDIPMGIVIDSVENDDLIDAGVLSGDILTHIDGERVYDLSDIRDTLDNYKVGDRVELSLYRKIGTRELTYEATCRLVESE